MLLIPLVRLSGALARWFCSCSVTACTLAAQFGDDRQLRCCRERGPSPLADPGHDYVACVGVASAMPLWHPPGDALLRVHAGLPELARQQEGPPPYRHISSTDVADPRAFWFTERATLLGDAAQDAWDPTKLINTDRPDFTDVATVVGPGVTQIETGYLQRRRDFAGTRIVSETIPNVLLRVGTSDSFEWRVKWRGNVRTEVTDITSGTSGHDTGLADVELGFKWVLSEQHDWAPMQTLVTRLGLPAGDDRVSAHRVEPGFHYIYNWQIRRWWFVRGATGADWLHQPQPFLVRSGGVPIPRVDVEPDAYVEISQAVSSYMQVSKRVGIFKEWFMFKRHGSKDDHADHYHNYGLYFYVTPDVQFDARIGWRVGDHFDENLLGFGFSTRF